MGLLVQDEMDKKNAILLELGIIKYSNKTSSIRRMLAEQRPSGRIARITNERDNTGLRRNQMIDKRG